MPLSDDQKKQLVQVWDEAVAADDKAAMQRVKDVLARDRAEAVRAAEQAGPQFNSGPEGMPMGTPGNARALREGVVEGGKRAYAGVKQAGASVYDYFARTQPGVSYEDKDSMSAKVTASEVLRQKMDQIDATKRLGKENAFGREVVANVAQTVPMAVAPEALLPATSTIKGAAVKNAIVGGIGGWTAFTKDMDNQRNAGIGAALNTGIGLGFSILPAAKNAIGRALLKLDQTSATAPRIAAAQKVLPNVEYSLAQRTGIPELKTLERAAYNSDQVKFFANQTDKFVEDFANVMRQPVKAGDTLDSTFLATKKRAEEALTTARMRNSQNYEAGMSKAATMNQPAPGKATQIAPVRIPTSDYQNQLATLAERASDPVEGVAPAFGKYVDDLLYQAKKGYLSPRELAAHLRGLTGKIKEGGQEGALAGRLKDALERDLDRLEMNGTLKANETAQQIIETRKEYRRGKEAIELMQESAAYKLLGVNDASAGSDVLVQKFNSFTREKQAQVRKYLEANSPEMLTAMRQKVIDDAVQSSKTIREAADSQQSLEQLTENLFDAKKGFDLRSHGLWSADDIKNIEGIKDGLRVISNNRPALGGAGTPIKPEDIVINLVSRSSEFASRQLTRVLMSSKASNFFTDPEIYKHLTQIVHSTTGNPKNTLARAALINYLQENYEAEDEDGAAQ